MSRWAYYNDSEPFVCDWLENLIREGLLPAGEVDRRPIQEVSPDDVRGFQQCHFFAGIGGWAYALQLAGWPDDRPVWTGSCPCQPFSAAGKGQAEDDPRHLWPHWFRLIRECRPIRIFGEQVANAAGHGWFDVVATDLEAEAYTVGAVVLGAHSVGAPHIRQRIWFVADSEGEREGALIGVREGSRTERNGSRVLADSDGSRCGTGRAGETGDGRDAPRVEPSGLRITGVVGDAAGGRRESRAWFSRVRHADDGTREATDEQRPAGSLGELADTNGRGFVGRSPGCNRNAAELDVTETGCAPWAGCEFIPCRDGKARPVEPGTFPLAHGVPARVGRLRAYGNAINPYTAAAFVRAYMDCVAP